MLRATYTSLGGGARNASRPSSLCRPRRTQSRRSTLPAEDETSLVSSTKPEVMQLDGSVVDAFPNRPAKVRADTDEDVCCTQPSKHALSRYPINRGVR